MDNSNQYRLSLLSQVFFVLLSWAIVGFGQPAWSLWSGLVAAAIGYALFFRVLLAFPNPWHRFWMASAWYFSVQLVQLSWFIAHPFLYIYAVYLFAASIMGLQMGIVGWFVDSERLRKIRGVLFIAALWTLLEWSRLFILSGLSWNPSGIALTGSLYALQMASLWGIYGLSFWVLLVNSLALRAWINKSLFSGVLWIAAASIPYLYGVIQMGWQEQNSAKEDSSFQVVLVQTAFPVEEAMVFRDLKHKIEHVIGEWQQILKIIRPHKEKAVDMVVLPEYMVPLGTYSFVYPYSIVASSFEKNLGPEAKAALPPLELPLANQINTVQGPIWFVSNAYWAQGIANAFQTDVVVGLEDAEDVGDQREFYSAAIHFVPSDRWEKGEFQANRYSKRVLVPMAEYIPFSFCREIAAEYGITGSFTCGNEAKVFSSAKIPFGLSICYEETFGNLMRESRMNGAQLLVNLTSDVWFPGSRLMQQHFDHARLRTVEAGIPLVRACNTGITGAIDSLGRVVAILGESPEKAEWLSDSLFVKVPTHHYFTLYSKLGDSLIIGLSLLLFLCGFKRKNL